MKEMKIILWIICCVVGLAGCEAKKRAEPKVEIIAQSTSCETAPDELHWSGATYRLKSTNSAAEPGMKYGFLSCDKGKFIPGDGGPGTFILYSAESAETRGDIMMFGKWGRGLYSKNPF
jgi:hypothetical protein